MAGESTHLHPSTAIRMNHCPMQRAVVVTGPFSPFESVASLSASLSARVACRKSILPSCSDLNITRGMSFCLHSD